MSVGGWLRRSSRRFRIAKYAQPSMPVPWYGFCFVFFVLFFLFFSFPSCSYSRLFCAFARSRAYLDGVVEGGAEKHSRTTHDVDGIETLRNTGADQTLHGELRRRRGEEERGKYASIAVSVSFSLAPTRRTPKKKRKRKKSERESDAPCLESRRWTHRPAQPPSTWRPGTCPSRPPATSGC